jgi:hypothetical protein
MKKSNDTIGNQTRDLPACSAVLQERVEHKKNAAVTWGEGGNVPHIRNTSI